jgi:hypothetical protein
VEGRLRLKGMEAQLTAARLHQFLVDAGQAIGERTVREMVAEWKRRQDVRSERLQELPLPPRACRVTARADRCWFGKTRSDS